MSWLTREFQFSKSQAEREFNCPLHKSYFRATKTAKGTKWERDLRKTMLSKFTLTDNPCQRAFLFCNREKAKEFFEKDWAKRKGFKDQSEKKEVPRRSRAGSPVSQPPSQTDLSTPMAMRMSIKSPDQLKTLSSCRTVQDKYKKIGIYVGDDFSESFTALYPADSPARLTAFQFLIDDTYAARFLSPPIELSHLEESSRV